MDSIAKKLAIFSFLAVLVVVITGCSSHTFVQGESLIMPTKDLTAYTGQKKVVIMDIRTADGYDADHVVGAVNIPIEDIVINVPVKNMLTSKKKIEKVMGENDISSDTLVLAYDSNRVDASCLLWSLFMHGHQNVKVIGGGFDAIQGARIPMTMDVSTPELVAFTAREPSCSRLADMDDVRKQAEQPDSHVILLDVCTQEEFAEKGKVPGSAITLYETDFFSDGTFKTTQIIRINYLEDKIYPEDEITVHYQTSMRAASVFVRLYEAGYWSIRICDGAYLEWFSDSDNPVEMSTGGATPVKKSALQDLGYTVNSNE